MTDFQASYWRIHEYMSQQNWRL